MGENKRSPREKKGFACRDCKLALLLGKAHVRKITKYFQRTCSAVVFRRGTSVKLLGNVKQTDKDEISSKSLINISFIHTQNHSSSAIKRNQRYIPLSFVVFVVALLAFFRQLLLVSNYLVRFRFETKNVWTVFFLLFLSLLFYIQPKPKTFPDECIGLNCKCK